MRRWRPGGCGLLRNTRSSEGMSRGRLQGGRAMADSRSRYTRVGHPVLESHGSCGSLDRQTIGCCERKSLRNPRPAKERHRIGRFQDTERLHGQLAYDPAPLRRAHAGGLALKNSVLTRAVEAWHGGVQNGNSLRCKALLGPRVTASPGPAPGHIDRLAPAAMDLGNFGQCATPKMVNVARLATRSV